MQPENSSLQIVVIGPQTVKTYKTVSSILGDFLDPF